MPPDKEVPLFESGVNTLGNSEADVLCVACGYNLRGLPPEGQCPECTTPVAVSGGGDRLSSANPLWLFMLRRGVFRIAFVIPYLVLISTRIPLSTHNLLIHLMFIYAFFFSLRGIVFATTIEPRAHTDGAPKLFRRLGIACAIVATVLGVLGFAAWYRGRFTMMQRLDAVGHALLLFGIVFALLKLSLVARRIPNSPLATLTLLIAVLLVCCTSLSLMGDILDLWVLPFNAPSWHVAQSFASLVLLADVGTAGLFAVGFFAPLLLWRYYVAIKRANKESAADYRSVMAERESINNQTT